MEKKYFAESELIINEDGSIFHLHVKPEQLADKVILVGDPGRVDLVASHFETKECAVESREFRTVTGTYKGKRITVISTGIGCDNIEDCPHLLRNIADSDNYAIIFLTEELFDSVEKERSRYEEKLTPAIIPVPGVKGNTGTGLKRLSSFVEQAVGSDIIFND